MWRADSPFKPGWLHWMKCARDDLISTCLKADCVRSTQKVGWCQSSNIYFHSSHEVLVLAFQSWHGYDFNFELFKFRNKTGGLSFP